VVYPSIRFSIRGIQDDEPGVLDVTKRMLSFYQAQVIACFSAAEGLS
jgi:hypothetical protein